MVKGQDEARIGLGAEKNLVELLNNNVILKEKILYCLRKIGIKIDNISYAERPSRKKLVKTDILLCSAPTDDGCIGISLKTVKKTAKGFHSLDRRRLEEWRSLLGMDEEVFSVFKESILRVARNRREVFIRPNDREKIKNFINKNIYIILKEIFLKNEYDLLKVLAVLDLRKSNRKLYLLNINKLIDFIIENYSIDFSRKGIIIIKVKNKPLITIQRKGGNGKHVKRYRKTDWEHPGNQLQFKIKPILLVELIKNYYNSIICELSI